MKTPSLALALFMLVACGDDDGRSDAGGRDSGPTPDSAVADSGAIDAGAPSDAGPGQDTGAPDASTTDAGPSGPRGGLCPATEMCNVVLGTGCEAAESCFVAGGADSAMSVCAPAGAVALGGTCMAADECQLGLSCIGNTCQPLCCGDSDADCPAGGVCNGLSNLEGIGVCLLPDGCDLVMQTGCGAMLGCYPLSSEGGTRCATSGAAAVGAACEASNDCAGGTICLDDGVCHSLCALESETCGDQRCAPLNGFDEVGVCVAPS
ncbi:MAG: hypothetical protein ACI9KE_003538 [Polyangiales bacterium]|jgi:hypothetical protein